MNFLLNKLNNFFKILLSNTMYSLPVFETLIGINLVIIRIVLNATIDSHNYMIYEAPFYDTGTLMSLLILLEHIFVTYYLIIIIVMVYWCLYVFIVDFASWNTTDKNNILKWIFIYLINNFMNLLLYIYIQLYIYILKLVVIFKEFKSLLFLYNTHSNTIDQFPFNLNKKNLLEKNIINIFSNFFKQFDYLGRSILILNYSNFKFIIILSLLVESISLLQEKFNYKTYIVKKKMTYYLFYSKPKSFFFLSTENNFNNNKSNKLSYSSRLNSLRSLYNNVFDVNKFKHSGIFEAIWAAFPTIIIVSILIPSLILLYSFEDILNPKMTIKVIGNQWYWTYEFDNWIEYNKIEKTTKISELTNNNKVIKEFLEYRNNLNYLEYSDLNWVNCSNDIINKYFLRNLVFRFNKLLITTLTKIHPDMRSNLDFSNRFMYLLNKYPTFWGLPRPEWNDIRLHPEWNKFVDPKLYDIKNTKLYDIKNTNLDKIKNPNFYDIKNPKLYDIKEENLLKKKNTKLYDIKFLAEETLTTKKNIYMNFSFNSVIIDLDSLQLGEKRLLEVDNRLVLSTNLTTRFLVSSVDVLHAFAVPELGLKIDAVPGRLNQILVFINRPGVYYGQCSELCGANHGFMPIVVQAVKPSDYLKYIEKIKNSL